MRKIGAPAPEHLFVSAHGPIFAETNRKQLHRLPDPEFIQAIRAFGGLPDAVIENRELLAIALPILRADFEMYETHRHKPGEPLAIPITAMGGSSDGSVPETHLEAWRGETTGHFGKRMFPCGHFYPQTAVPELARVILDGLMLECALR